MNNNKAMLLMGGGTLGIVGILMLGTNWKVGLLILAAAIGLVAYVVKQSSPKRVIPPQQEVEVPQHNQQAMMSFIKEPAVTDQKTFSRLKRVLYQANLDPRAPLLLGERNETVLSVQEVLVEIISIASAHGLPVTELEKDIKRVYSRIFENVPKAIAEYPTELELLTLWLANRSLKDVRKELDTESANVRTRAAD